MSTRVQCGLSAGVAIVGASVLAVAPLTTALPMAQESHQVSSAGVELSAASDPLAAALVLAQGLLESGERAGGAVALAPLTPGFVGAGLALGDNDLAYSALRQSIDAPLWAADPTIDALAMILPAPIGGGTADETPEPTDGAIIKFRDNVLWAATNAIRTPIAEALGVDPALDENPQAVLGAGLLQSGERVAEGAILAPLGLIPVAQAIASGDKEDLYVAIRQYIDAPLWAADPTINGLAHSLPAPLGGGTADNNGNVAGDGAIVKFRDNVLWKATNQTRTVVAKVLDVDPSLGNQAVAASARGVAPTVTENEVLGSANLGKATPGSSTLSVNSSSKSDRPQPVRATVKAVSDQLKAGADRIEHVVKKVTGTDNSDKEKKSEKDGE